MPTVAPHSSATYAHNSAPPYTVPTLCTQPTGPIPPTVPTPTLPTLCTHTLHPPRSSWPWTHTTYLPGALCGPLPLPLRLLLRALSTHATPIAPGSPEQLPPCRPGVRHVPRSTPPMILPQVEHTHLPQHHGERPPVGVLQLHRGGGRVEGVRRGLMKRPIPDWPGHALESWGLNSVEAQGWGPGATDHLWPPGRLVHAP
jgi:hypothetical protein